MSNPLRDGLALAEKTYRRGLSDGLWYGACAGAVVVSLLWLFSSSVLNR